MFRGSSRYQYGKGIGDVLRGIWRCIPSVARFLKQVAIKGAQTLLISSSEAIKKGATVKDVIKPTLKATIGAVLGATVDQVASNLIQMRDNHDVAPPPNPPMLVPEIVRAGSGRKCRRAPVYKTATKRIKFHLINDKLFIIFKMATIGGDVTENNYQQGGSIWLDHGTERD